MLLRILVIADNYSTSHALQQIARNSATCKKVRPKKCKLKILKGKKVQVEKSASSKKVQVGKCEFKKSASSNLDDYPTSDEIRWALKRAEMTQAELSKHIKTTQRQISKWVNGEVKINWCAWLELRRLAKI